MSVIVILILDGISFAFCVPPNQTSFQFTVANSLFLPLHNNVYVYKQSLFLFLFGLTINLGLTQKCRLRRRCCRPSEGRTRKAAKAR